MASGIKIRPNRVKSGDIVEIICDIGCIPAGIYKLENKEAGFYCFEVKGGGVFGISHNYKKYIRKVNKSERSSLTSAECFINRYFQLIYSCEKNPDAKIPFPTYCAVDPRSLAYLDESLTENSEFRKLH